MTTCARTSKSTSAIMSGNEDPPVTLRPSADTHRSQRFYVTSVEFVPSKSPRVSPQLQRRNEAELAFADTDSGSSSDSDNHRSEEITYHLKKEDSPTQQSSSRSTAVELASANTDSGSSSSSLGESETQNTTNDLQNPAAEQDRETSTFQQRRHDHRSVRLFRPAHPGGKKVVSVVPWSHRSFRLSRNKPQDEQDQSSIEDDDFFSEDDPTTNMSKKTRKRARKALKTLQAQLLKDSEEKSTCQSCWTCCCEGAHYKSSKAEKEPPASLLTPELKKALNEGFTMIKVIAFPTLPAVFQDLWVYLEFLVTLAAFVFAMIDFYPFTASNVYTSVYFSLTIFSLCLAVFDAYAYFIELGSCGRAIRYIRTRSKHQNEEEGADEDNIDKDEIKGRGCFKEKWRQYFSTFFEIGRNIASETILYPLIVFDLFDFIVERLYQPVGSIKRADFSIFIVGSFYLLLAVYIMRIFVLAGSMFSLVKISSNKKLNSTSENENNGSSSFLVLFCIHVLGQIIIHLTTVIAVAAKINNENSVSTDDNDQSNSTSNFTFNEITTSTEDNGLPNASVFLWVVIAIGWVMPITGIIMFFPINIYWMRQFSISFWLNMISLVKSKSFAETVFGGDGLSSTKNKAMDFIEKSQYKKVKKQLSRYKSASFLTKVFYPMRITYAALSGLVYDVAIVAFLASLMLTYQDGVVKIVIFKDDHIMTAAFFLSAICIIVANIHVLVLLNFLLIIIIAFGTFYILCAIMVSPLLLLLYFPSVGVLGYVYLFIDWYKEKKAREEAAQRHRNHSASTTRERVKMETARVDSVDAKKKNVKMVSFEPEVETEVKETPNTVTSV